MNLIIKPLSPQLTDDYLLFFDHVVFSEHPDWSKCYCYSYHFTGTKQEWSRERNRSAVIELIRTNKMKGYLAYDQDKPIGWCNANNRNNFQSLSVNKISQSTVCSIVCFLINPEYRRKGIAQKILENVINDYTLMGYEYLEAYPKKEKQSCERNYHGHFSMYEKYIFKVEEEFDDHFVVRKKLGN